MMNISVNERTGEAFLSAPPPEPRARNIWEIRTEEQAYAYLGDTTFADTNRYGQKIDLIEHTEHKLPPLLLRQFAVDAHGILALNLIARMHQFFSQVAGVGK